jgi:hypothetical protein
MKLEYALPLALRQTPYPGTAAKEEVFVDFEELFFPKVFLATGI